VSVDVANVGTRPGKEVVQLYLRDLVASVVVPVRRLRGFEKVALRAGETRTVRFTLRPDDLALLDGGLRWTVEPGAFEVAVGTSSRKAHLTGRFEVLP
jgi:beta-glucosidase